MFFSRAKLHNRKIKCFRAIRQNTKLVYHFSSTKNRNSDYVLCIKRGEQVALFYHKRHHLTLNLNNKNVFVCIVIEPDYEALNSCCKRNILTKRCEIFQTEQKTNKKDEKISWQTIFEPFGGAYTGDMEIICCSTKIKILITETDQMQIATTNLTKQFSNSFFLFISFCDLGYLTAS